MLGFYDKMAKVKEQYLKNLVERVRDYENIVIYGAGRVAKPIVYRLREENLEIKCFTVTDININENSFLGIPVVQIDNLSFEPEKTVIIIAVKYVWAEEVLLNIKDYQYQHYIYPPKEIDYFAREQTDEVHRPVMEISVKAGCSVNCKYCPQDLFLSTYFKRGDRCKELTFEKFKICLGKLPKETVISFCGFSEPFLNSEAVDMIEYTHRCGYDIQLFTTLVGLTKSDFQRIKDIPFSYVVLHTPDSEGFANIPMTDEYFELLDMALGSKKPDGSNFIDTANCQGVPHEKVIEHTKGRLRIMSELYDRAGNIKESIFKGIERKEGKLYCVRVNRKLNYNVMLPDGTVVLCNFDFGMKHVLGNLLEDTYASIMNGKGMQDVLKALDDDHCELLCRKCNYAVGI